MPGSARFRRAERLRDARDFKRLAALGRRATSRSFVVLATRRGDGATPRLGITTSRRVGDAVRRNRVRRLVREWFRHAKAELPPGLDVVVIGRSPAATLDSQSAARELGRLLGEAAP